MASAAVDETVTENIRIVQARLRETGITTLPERYLWPSPVVTQETKESGLTLPVIDLEGVIGGDLARRKDVARQIGIAAAEWGFFQVVNHGIPEPLVERMQSHARHFFDMPLDVLDRVQTSGTQTSCGYDGKYAHIKGMVPWQEIVGAKYENPPGGLEALAKAIWPEGNSTFCNTFHEYHKAVQALGLQLFELLAESLGLQTNFFSQHFVNPSEYSSIWKFSHYPTCPDPSHAFGIPPHVDPKALAILKQDDVGGLEVLKGGKWVGVKPLQGAFVINIGDPLEAWTNGRCASVEHRVVLNEHTDRFSMVYFFGPSPSLLIAAPPELIDEEHPSLYTPFTLPEYFSAFFSVRGGGVRRGGEEGRRGKALEFFRKTPEI